MMRFDPRLLPSPAMLDQLRDLNARSRQTIGAYENEWYTPVLLFGAVGYPLLTGRAGVIPIVYDCSAIGWTLSSNVPGSLTLRLTYGDYASLPTYVTLSTANAPTLGGTRRNRYEEIPYISGWRDPLFRLGEIEVWVDAVTTCEQVELVLYMKRLR